MLIGLVVVSLILLTVYFGESAGSPLHSVQRGVLAVLSPVQDGASRALKPARDLFGWVGDTFHAKKERDQLRAQRDQLLRTQIDDQELIAQNRSLRALARLDSSYGLDQYHKVTARIIGRSPNNLLKDTMTVSSGSGAGVAVGDAVIGGSSDLAGLVGHVTTVAGDASVVTLITDQSSTVGGRILNNNGDGPIGLVKPSIGNPLDLLVQQLPQRANVREGDNVVTSGIIDRRFPSPYPEGIPIGRVRSADQAELASSNQVHISPYADLRHLDFVQILTTSPADVAARAQVP
ncbi:MAG TPA: rod shape-determining protein MreC [Conexibacter sp.]